MSGIIASMALLATAALATSVGEAVVVNKCKYEVKLCAVPAAGGGYDEVDKTMSPNETWSQQWTELTNSYGWSIKMNPMDSTDNEILQYEYTFHNDGTIWYDLSEVNGNPWDGNWEITSSESSCAPKQQAYRYATDDAYGMQACPDSASITVTLCSGESQDDSSASSVSASVASASSSAASAGTTLAASTTVAAPSSAFSTSATSTSAEAVSTTMVTSAITSAPASSTSGDVVVTVTNVAYTTEWTHPWGGPSKRDAHQHHHAARHPHQRA